MNTLKILKQPINPPVSFLSLPHSSYSLWKGGKGKNPTPTSQEKCLVMFPMGKPVHFRC